MLCPTLDDATDKMKKLSYAEKLKIIENEAETLYEFCLKQGFKKSQIRQLLEPFFGEQKSILTRIYNGSKITLMRLGIIVAVLAIILKWESASRLIWVHTKLLSYKTLPIYDWTHLYDKDCLIFNTFKPDITFSKDDCLGCTRLKNIERLVNVKQTTVTDHYFQNNLPFVVSDAIRDWPKDEGGNSVMTLGKIKELYLSHDHLTSGLDECITQSTLEQENVTIHSFMQMLHDNKLPEKFHYSWENCVPKAAKVFRLYSRRPYFLPPMAEASRANQFAVAKGSFEHEFSLPQQIDQASWFVVLSGSANVTLLPIHECMKFNCQPITFQLSAGEAAVVPTRIWEVSYSPKLENNYTMIFASTVVWDNVN